MRTFDRRAWFPIFVFVFLGINYAYAKVPNTVDDVKKMLSGGKYFYVNVTNDNRPIIGRIVFNKKVTDYVYRELIGRHQKGKAKIRVLPQGFKLLNSKKYVKIKKRNKFFIQTNYKGLLRFYKKKEFAQGFLERRGYDVTPPELILEGSDHVYVEQFQLFIEPGYSATDNHDGILSVTRKGKVDTDTLGDYTLVYQTKDSSGNFTRKRRKVTVIPNDDAVIHHVQTMAQLRAALKDAALNGVNDIIMLDKGIYNTQEDEIGTFKFQDDEEQNLTLRAEPGLTADQVILDGNFTDRVLKFDGKSKAYFSLEGVTITHGRSSGNGAGVEADNDLNIVDCIIEDNKIISSSLRKKFGGGFAVGGNVHLIRSAVKRNSTNHNSPGGGGYASGQITIYHSDVSENTSRKYGGGLFGASINIYNSLIKDNNSSTCGDNYYGGGGFNVTYDAFISKSTIINNKNLDCLSKGGGGFTASNVTLIDSVVKDNYSRWKGGGFYAGKNATVYRSKIVGNYALQAGGGFYVDGLLKANRLRIIDNNAHKGSGGGFYAKNKCYLSNSFIKSNNSDKSGDAFYAEYAYVMNNTFMKNDGSAYAANYSVFINNIFDPDQEGNNIVIKGEGWVINNYIDDSTIYEKGDVFKKQNLKPSVVGPLHLKKNLYPTLDSPTILKGIDTSDPLFQRAVSSQEIRDWLENSLKKDLLGRDRHRGIDIGAVNYRPRH